MSGDFILRRYLVTVARWGEAVILAASRGKAMADVWRSDAFTDAFETAAEEHAAELAQGPEAALGDDPIGMMEHTPETVEDFEGDTEA